MILAVILVIAAALALFTILGISVSHGLQVSSTPGLPGELQPIDIEAFRNLADPAEDAYLRRRLPDGDFRKVRRKRLLAMAGYIQTAGRNATALIQIAQRAIVSGNPQTAEAAEQLLNDALLLRRNAGVALVKIYVLVAWPGPGLSAAPLITHYERLSGSAMLLGRLQNPADPVRISAN